MDRSAGTTEDSGLAQLCLSQGLLHCFLPGTDGLFAWLQLMIPPQDVLWDLRYHICDKDQAWHTTVPEQTELTMVLTHKEHKHTHTQSDLTKRKPIRVPQTHPNYLSSDEDQRMSTLPKGGLWEETHHQICSFGFGFWAPTAAPPPRLPTPFLEVTPKSTKYMPSGQRVQPQWTD